MPEVELRIMSAQAVKGRLMKPIFMPAKGIVWAALLLAGVAGVLVLSSASSQAVAQNSNAPIAVQYLSAAPDVPLAAGLNEASDAGMVFDKPQGRIVQITANMDGTKSRRTIIDFYRASLPNLGWQRIEYDERERGAPKGRLMRLTFARKGEILRLTFTDELVFFNLAPEGR